MNSKRALLNELTSRQRKDVPVSKKLTYKDITRISKNIDCSVFGEACCIWQGYITNLNKENKSHYINFYFKDKKVALHRLLYLNYVDNISDSEYLKFSCENKGKCCNINHFIKYEKDTDIAVDHSDESKISKTDDDFKVIFN